MMKEELDHTSAQIRQMERKGRESEWDSLDLAHGKSIGDLREHQTQLVRQISKIQKEIKNSRSRSLLVAELAVLPAVFLMIIFSGVLDTVTEDAPGGSPTLRTRYLIENLQGDTIDTWKSWRLVGNTLNVNVLKSPRVTDHQLEVIRNAITSDRSMEIDDFIVHKGPRGSTSTYYEGWSGALKSIQQDTKYNIPTQFNFINTPGGEGDIIITLSNIRDSDGYTGYTKSIIENNEILKSFITIYDISNLTDEQLSTIIRHEFGHALGLGHSTASEDLMAPTIDMTIPYISECNIDAIANLYNGGEGGQTVCRK